MTELNSLYDRDSGKPPSLFISPVCGTNDPLNTQRNHQPARVFVACLCGHDAPYPAAELGCVLHAERETGLLKTRLFGHLTVVLACFPPFSFSP